MWTPGNYLAWQIYQASNTQFNHDFHVSPLQIMDEFGITDKRRMLKKVGLIHQCAVENQK